MRDWRRAVVGRMGRVAEAVFALAPYHDDYERTLLQERLRREARMGAAVPRPDWVVLAFRDLAMKSDRLRPGSWRRVLLAILVVFAPVLWIFLRSESVAVLVAQSRHESPHTSPGERTADKLRVLFVGNSFTYYHGGQPAIIGQIAASLGQARPTVFEQVTASGFSFRAHWRWGLPRRRIEEGNWDYVVLQDRSDGPLVERDSFFQYARLFDREITRTGAKTLFFMTWALAGQDAEQDRLADAYNRVARELGDAVAPVGLAWREALRADPRLALHEADGKHPSAAGSYLTACVFYSLLYGQSPVGAAGRIVVDGLPQIDLEPSIATELQRAAARTVFGPCEMPATAPAATPAGAPR